MTVRVIEGEGRAVLVPALVQLFGRANWWIPGWLDRALPGTGPRLELWSGESRAG